MQLPEHLSREQLRPLSPEALLIVEDVWNCAIERLSPANEAERQTRRQRDKVVFEREDPKLYKRLIGAASATLDLAKAAAAGHTIDIGGYVNHYIVQHMQTFAQQPGLFSNDTKPDNVFADAAQVIAKRILRRAELSVQQLAHESFPPIVQGESIECILPDRRLLTVVDRISSDGTIAVQATDPSEASLAAYILGFKVLPEDLHWRDQHFQLSLGSAHLQRYEEYLALKSSK